MTAAVRNLEKRGLVSSCAPTRTTERARRVELTDAGRELIAKAVPLWRDEHAKLEAEMKRGEPDRLRSGLRNLHESQVSPT